MSKNEATREQARQILKNGILDMSIARLIQMSNYGLHGFIEFESTTTMVQNPFNCILHDEESNVITFIAKETEEKCYGAVSFVIDAITEISGCEDSEKPDTVLNINISLDDDTAIRISVLY